ncbi:TPA: ERF family protein [Streptococcus suis]
MVELTFPELQQKMQLEKEQKQGVKYPFRTAEDIYNKFKKLDSGWSVSFPEDDIKVIKDKIYYKAVAVARRESDGIEQKAVGWAREEDVPVFHTQKGDVKQMQDPQWTGAVGSYARKYALQGLFAIGGEDVDEHPVEENQQAPQDNKQGQPNQPPQAKYITNEQYTEIVGWIRSLAQSLNKPFDEVEQGYLNHYRITNFHQVPVEHFDTVVHHIKSQVDKYKQPQNDFNNL